MRRVLFGSVLGQLQYIFSHLEIFCAVFFFKGWFVTWPQDFFLIYGLYFGNSVGTAYLPSDVSEG